MKSDHRFRLSSLMMSSIAVLSIVSHVRLNDYWQP